MSTFSELGLSESLLKVLPELGFETPSPIQQQSIPLLASELRDFIGLAQTGTGKTAAFGLPLLDHIDEQDRTTQALIVAPTRELCQQIAAQLVAFAKYLPNVHIQTVYGGAPIVAQIRALKAGAQIVVATPGRLIDLLNRKAVKLDKVDYVILDEADEMLNMGFKEDIDAILSHTPETKVTWLFSATMPSEIRTLIRKFMSDPLEVSVQAGNVVNKNIEHQYTVIKASDKVEVLRRFIDFQPDMFGIVFCRTKIDTQQLATELTHSGYHAEALHGDLSQVQRDQVMKKFKAHAVRLLIATDVAARGIDVTNLTHVIHFSLPDDQEYYTHRSGRTARAGKTGISLALITHHDVRKIRFLEKKLGIRMEKVEVPGVGQILKSRLLHWAERILETEPNENLDSKIYQAVLDKLEGLNRETLITKMLSHELELLGYKEVREKNLNDDRTGDRKGERAPLRDKDKSPRDRGRDRVSGGRERTFTEKDRPAGSEKRAGSKGSGRMERFFINIGSMDDVNKGDLLRFICDQTRLKKDDFGDIELHKKHSFFEVRSQNSDKISNSFQGLVVDGRELRVNKDQPKR